MPRGKGNSTGSAQSTGTPVKVEEFDWGGFINVRIDEDDKAQYDLWAEDNDPTMWVNFQDYLGRGFKFSLAYDPKGDFYLATFTAAGTKLIGIDLRCCLTARAPKWETAISLLMFKHEVLAHGNWGSYLPSQMKFANFG